MIPGEDQRIHSTQGCDPQPGSFLFFSGHVKNILKLQSPSKVRVLFLLTVVEST